MTASAEYLRYFPYDDPYDHQREAMDRIADALVAGSDVLFEGATGTGKTLAALAPALAHARDRDKTVCITTNVHQQMRQFVRDASAITDSEPIRAVVFRGKGSMCHVDVGYRECQALRDTTRDLVGVERDQRELETKGRELLSRSRSGDGDAAESRSAIMDELDDLDEALVELRDQPTCDHYYRNLTADTEEFFGWLFADVRSPDEIYERAHAEGLCGYELLKEGVEGVDLVVCNYHHLLDPNVREQFFRWLGRDPEDVVAVVDEAHNVADAARSHARRTIAEETIEGALSELSEATDARADAAANVVETFLDALREVVEAAPEAAPAAVGEDWTDVPVDADDGKDDLTMAFLRAYAGPGFDDEVDLALELGRDLDEAYERRYKRGETATRTECQTLAVARFLDAWFDEADARGTYPVVSVRRAGEGGSSPIGEATGTDSEGLEADLAARVELYDCIPRQVTRSLFADLHASVLMSATLQPFDVAASVLGLDDPERMAYGQQFPEERRRTLVVDGPALFASSRSDPGVQATVTEVLEDAVRFTPGNTLVFFPSYAEAARYHDRLSVGTRYLDEPGTQARDLREAFTADDDGVLCTSLWGTLGEGVSFDGDDARTVVVVGVPYPHLDERMEAVQSAYDAAFDESEAGWRYAVEIPTIRKTRQALGRVVRSPEDFGARVLLDARYTERAQIEMAEYAVRGTFPAEERAEMVDVGPEKLKFSLLNFYADLDAYDGEPPTP